MSHSIETINEILNKTPQSDPHANMLINLPGGAFGIENHLLRGGQREGTQLIRLSGEQTSISVIPTRGMGLWRATSNDQSFGWDSPVKGPIHPAFVPVAEPSGLGWLSGFDELLVRCGLESNGAPEFAPNGTLRYPLHGRIANLPAESLRVDVDHEAQTLTLEGTVRESRLFFADWTLRTKITIPLKGHWVEITDTVTNESDSARTGQLLYHINVGSPLLGQGASLLAPYKRLVPKTPRAVEGISQFDHYGPPETGFAEQVYLMDLHSDDDHWTRVLLSSPDKQTGLGVEYDSTNLPYFVQWKNTGGLKDGYVTGLEPSTNFPNTRSFEESHGRVVKYGPGESRQFSLRLHFLVGGPTVADFADRVHMLQKNAGELEKTPRPDWCQ